ncbi:MAG: hypothetical protein JWQ21_815 [Herminiimonas sp.]|nr:hypothetical protein [Herminiimonas sp.]
MTQASGVGLLWCAGLIDRMAMNAGSVIPLRTAMLQTSRIDLTVL